MNKVVLIFGSITVIVVGGLFFCAGMFTGADLTNTLTTESSKEIASSIKEKVSSYLSQKKDTEIKVLATNDEQIAPEEEEADISQEASQSGILLEKPVPHITTDSILNDVIASHETNDQCLLDNVKTEKQEKIAMNNDKKNLVFIGYFSLDTAQQISKLLMTKGYPAHIQPANANQKEAFVFCGPFKTEENAQKLVQWLQQHNFKNAKIIEQKQLTAEHLEKELSEFSAVPTNSDNITQPENIADSENTPESENISESEDSSDHESDHKTEGSQESENTDSEEDADDSDDSGDEADDQTDEE